MQVEGQDAHPRRANGLGVFVRCTMSKTTDDYAPCVRIDANGNTRKGNVKAALLLTPDAARAAPVGRGVVYVRVEDAEAVRRGDNAHG